MMMSKLLSMRDKSSANWLFFEDNNGTVYYSLVSRTGKILKKGQVIISMEAFCDYLQKLGFEYVDAIDFARG
jgi:hypothetical protein